MKIRKRKYKLTKEQKERKQYWIDEATKVKNCVDPIDEEKAKIAISNLLRLYDMYDHQKFLFFANREAVHNYLKDTRNENLITESYEVNTHVDWIYIALWRDDFCKRYGLMPEEIVKTTNNPLNRTFTQINRKPYSKYTVDELHLWVEVVKNCGRWWPFEKYILVSGREKPKVKND